MVLQPYKKYLEETVIPLRLACQTESGWPIILSLWYMYQEGSLYLATRATAKVVDYLKNDPRCAFEIASDLPPYCGVRGQAEAEILPQLGGDILEQLLHRYIGSTTNPLAQNLLKNRASEVAISLRPASVYTWNFTDRMRDSSPVVQEKVCPDLN
jgi:nitroimidazol reductase NimA-like FMN-containing flavoprotein (pyridoxamine 5'-phosphate oxidase superfamily)